MCTPVHAKKSIEYFLIFQTPDLEWDLHIRKFEIQLKICFSKKYKIYFSFSGKSKRIWLSKTDFLHLQICPIIYNIMLIFDRAKKYIVFHLKTIFIYTYQ